MIKQPPLIRIALALYLVMFFTYLLGPLILMSLTAFNSASFPQVIPWEVFSFEWFRTLINDDKILLGLFNSLRIGILTIILSVSMGLAGALVLTQIWPKFRATYYTVLIVPILIPGVVLGISTLVFWDRVNHMLGFTDASLLKDGMFLTVMGQSTFIASYCMLVFIARLQRFDVGLTEAALDLGATHVQAFRKIQLPFLFPAIASASVLALLASFENYNTTTFTFLSYPTLTIVLAQKVRLGINPSISALAFLIITLTVFFALVNEVRARRAQLAVANGAPVGSIKGGFALPRFFAGNPAAIILALFIATAVGTVILAQIYDPEPAKQAFIEKKRAAQKKAIEALRKRARQKQLEKQMKGPKIFETKKKTGASESPGKSEFGGVFKPGNLEKAAGAKDKKKPVGVNPGKGTFGNIFKSDNLDKVAPKAKPSN